MDELLALMIIILWLLIPLFWIPVHLMTALFRRLGILTYLVVFTIWSPLAFLIYKNSFLFLGYVVTVPLIIRIGGWILFIGGLLIHLWTLKLLGLAALVGLPEISQGQKGRFINTGAFSIVRHPTYLAHTMIFSGAFLVSGVIALGVLTIIDLLVVLLLIIPIEERELMNRFGDEYIEYKKRVPRFLPSNIMRIK
ncbi:MAG: hypothetical protein Fur0020_06890 [Thermodesulfovibrionia bacterium]